MDRCSRCDRALTSDEIGLHKRLINRGDTVYMCRDCLAAYFKVSPALLDKKIAYFKAQGCTLFSE